MTLLSPRETSPFLRPTPGGRLTLTEGMVAEVSGRLLPATLLVRRLSASGPTS